MANKVRGTPIKREKVFFTKNNTRPNSARKINTKRRRRAVTWSKFHTEKNLQVIASLCRKGWPNEDIADYIGISVSTLYEWQKVHSEFSEALSEGKDYSVAVIEDAVFQKAKGIEKEVTSKETTTVDVLDRDGRKIGEKTTVTEKQETIYVPPDTRAGIFYLTNRCGDDWKQKQQTELMGSLAVDANISVTGRMKLAQQKERIERDSK